MNPRRFPTIARRGKTARVPLAAMLGLVVAAAIGAGALVQTIREDGSERDQVSGSAPAGSSFRLSSSHSAEERVSVPDVVGLGEAEAVKALGASALVANVRYADEAPRTGKVLRSDPEAGNEVAANSVVVLAIAHRPRLPMPEPHQDQPPEAFSRLIADHPKVFFGTYRDEVGVPVVVFGPGADPAAWQDRLTEAAESIDYPAEGVGYRTDTCARTRASLRAMQDEIATHQDWTANKHLSFTVGVDTRTCTVRVGSDLLTPADIRALVDRYGTAISFDTSKRSHPVLLPLFD